MHDLALVFKLTFAGFDFERLVEKPRRPLRPLSDLPPTISRLLIGRPTRIAAHEGQR